MNLKHILLVTLTIFFFNCDSDSDNTVDVGPDTDDGSLISSITEVDGEDGSTYTINFTYNGNNLISIADNDDYSAVLMYENDQLVRLEHYADGDLEEFLTYEYASDGTLAEYIVHFVNLGDIDGDAVKHVVTYNSDNTITEEVFRGDFNSQTQNPYTKIYNLSNGNITSESIEGDDEITTFQFDNRNSAYKNISAIEILELSSNSIESGFYFYGSNNNMIKLTDIQASDSYEDTFDYVYNDNDYPISATYKYFRNGELEYESTITYSYQ